MSKPHSETDQSPLVLRRHDRCSRLLIALALVALIAIAYWQVHAFGFVNYDDDRTITDNARVLGGLSVQNIKWALTTDYQCFRMPLVWLSLMLDREIAGVTLAHGIRLGPGNAGVFHLTNVLLHTASTLLLFFLLFRLTGYRYRSALVAALFAIHPLHVESVAWVTERKDVLSGFFFMLTLLFYANYARKPSIGRYLLVLGTFTLGLLSKTMLVTLPLILLMLDYWPLGRLRRGRAGAESMKRLVLEKVPLLALALFAGYLTWAAQQGSGAVAVADVYPYGARVLNAVTSYLVYVRQMLWPQGLVPFYLLSGRHLPLIPAVAGALWLLAASVYAYRTARVRPYVLVGWMWYVISLLPVIGIIQVGNQAHADRYTYLPLIGLFVATVWLAADLAEERLGPRKARALGAVASCLVVCVLTLLAHHQVSTWRNNVTLFEHALRCSRTNPVACNAMGIEMLHRKKPLAAARYFNEALEIWPGSGTYLNNLGQATEQTGKLDEAIAYYRRALRGGASQQTLATVEMNLGRVLVARGRCAEALPHVRAGLQMNPDALGVHNNLGYVLAALGRDAEAESEYRKELSLNPRSFDANLNLGRLMAKHHDDRAAIVYLRRAARLDSASVAAQVELAKSLVGAGKSHEAAKEIRTAIGLANRQAWHLSTSAGPADRDGSEAVLLAQFVCKQTKFRDPSALDTLAAAYAEAGRFHDAVQTASKAVAIAESSHLVALETQIRARLALYRAHKPYREPA